MAIYTGHNCKQNRGPGLRLWPCSVKAAAAIGNTPEGEERERHKPDVCTELAAAQPAASLVYVIHTVLIAGWKTL